MGGGPEEMSADNLDPLPKAGPVLVSCAAQGPWKPTSRTRVGFAAGTYMCLSSENHAAALASFHCDGSSTGQI